jgi:hypothetical protein
VSFKPSRPTHRIKVKRTDGDSKDSAIIGAAWLNDSGSITIKLHMGVSIAWNDGLTITAFPEGEEK